MKSFTKPASRMPRGIERDPAFEAASKAFENPPHVSPPPLNESLTSSALTSSPNILPTNIIIEQGITLSPSTENELSLTTASKQDEGRIEIGKISHTFAIQTPPDAIYPNKMTIYPEDNERKRLFTLRYEHRIAESIIAEYALEQFFLRHSDEEIVAAIRARGHGLRRKRERLEKKRDVKM
jgi:hypothetical protein